MAQPHDQSSSRSLPPNASLKQLRNQAKDLRKAFAAGDAAALARGKTHHPRLSVIAIDEASAAVFTLTDAQLVIAREYGFASWPKLKRSIENSSIELLDMHKAVMADGIQLVREVFQRDPSSVNQPSELGHTPLYRAKLFRNEAAVNFLLANGAELDIFACAFLGRDDEARKLLAEDASLVEATSLDGMTPLHFAARAGHYDVAVALLEHGANPNATDKDGGTALLEACHGGPWKPSTDERVVTLLLDHDAQVDLHTAAAMGRIELMERILAQDSTNIDVLNDRGQTPLFLAAKNNQLEAVKLLVKRGADVNLSDAVGTAALHRTSQECSDELIRFLIANGADAHLCCYVACGDVAGTQRTLQLRPESSNEVLYEYNAVGYAIHSWQLETLRVLLRQGCSLTEEDQKHILRISGNDEALLGELLSLEADNIKRSTD